MLDTPAQEFGPDADEDLPEEVLAAVANGKSALAAVREWKGIAVEDLARLAGVSAGTIHSAEGGQELSPEDQVKLAAALGVGADLFAE